MAKNIRIRGKARKSASPVAVRQRSREQLYTDGKTIRDTCPRASHAGWKPAADRSDSIEILEASNKGRRPELISVRYGRMIPSPFMFFRGAAAIMAADLAHTPNTGIRVQSCGDAHLMNSGAFATPERRVVFDINDFDETLPAPWEWDVKRLATSFAGTRPGRATLSDRRLSGQGAQFDEAVADFATAYARQNESDYEALVRAAGQGRIEVQTES